MNTKKVKKYLFNKNNLIREIKRALLVMRSERTRIYKERLETMPKEYKPKVWRDKTGS